MTSSQKKTLFKKIHYPTGILFQNQQKKIK